eukprot:CFRG3049T1
MMDSGGGNDAASVQRSNLLYMARLAIKRLIESGMSLRHQLTEKDVSVQQFCVMVEHTLQHGLKVRKNILGVPKTNGFWPYLCESLAQNNNAMLSVETLKNLPQLRTDMARSRAWIRLSLMEKRLAEHFETMLDPKNILITKYYYEPWAIMRCEESHIIWGLLIGVTAIDANLDLKSGDIGEGVIDLCRFLADGNKSPKMIETTEGAFRSESEHAATCTGQVVQETPTDLKDRFFELMNQKNFCEVSANSFRLQLEEAKKCIRDREDQFLYLEDIKKDRDRLKVALREEKLRCAQENKHLRQENLQTSKAYEVRILELEEANKSIRKQFETEMALRLDLERELSVVSGLLVEKNNGEILSSRSATSQKR